VLTKRAPDAGDSAQISSSFLRLGIFPVGRRPAARPSAGNANRWVAEPKSKCKTIFDSQISFLRLAQKFKTIFSSGTFQASSLGQYFFSKQVFKFSAFSFGGVFSLA
jgi:hypothetical protein